MPLPPACAPRNGAFGPARDLAQPQVEHLRHQLLARATCDSRATVSSSSALPLNAIDTDQPCASGSVDMLTSVSLCAGTLVSTVGDGALRRGNRRRSACWTSCSASATGMSPTTTTAMLIGAIPLLVEGEQPLARRVLQDFRQADRQPVGIARALEDDRQLLVGEARSGAEPAAPFLEDDAALLFDLRPAAATCRRRSRAARACPCRRSPARSVGMSSM